MPTPSPKLYLEGITNRGYQFSWPSPEKIFLDSNVRRLDDPAEVHRRLSPNVFYKRFTEPRRQALVDRVIALSDLPYYIMDGMLNGYDVITMSVYGGFPFAEKYVPIADIDVNVLVKESFFVPPPRENKPTISKGNPIYDKIYQAFERHMPGQVTQIIGDKLNLSILVMGEDNLVLGTPVDDTIDGSIHHLNVIPTKIVTFARRDIVLYGREYAPRINDENNVVIVVADLMLSAYRRLYGELTHDEPDWQKQKRAIDRLVESNLLLLDINSNLSINTEELITCTFKHLNASFSLADIQSLFNITLERLKQTDALFS